MVLLYEHPQSCSTNLIHAAYRVPGTGINTTAGQQSSRDVHELQGTGSTIITSTSSRSSSTIWMQVV